MLTSSWPPDLPLDPVMPVHQRPELGDQEFREAVRDIHAAALEELKDRETGRSVIQIYVQQWVQEQLRQAVAVSVVTQRRLVDAVFDEHFELGVLTELIKDKRVESIDINGCDETWVTYDDGACVEGPPVAASDEDLIRKFQMWALHKSYSPREFSAANPLVNTALKDENGVGVRLSATMGVSPRPYGSIRCHRLVDVTMTDLFQLGTINKSLRAFIEAAVNARLNIMISGATAAGKTTMLRAFASVIDPMERIATLETDFELFFHLLKHRHRNVIAFQARQANSEGVGAITLNDLIPHSLRKNIRRLFVGEVRADEIMAMFEAMNTGHPGSMCTIHADGAEEVFNRIVMLWTRGSSGVHTPPSVIHLNTGMTINLVVHLRMDPATNTRFISEVMEVMAPGDSDLPSRNHIYRPTGPAGRAMPDITPQCLPRLKAAGFDPALLDPHNAIWEIR